MELAGYIFISDFDLTGGFDICGFQGLDSDLVHLEFFCLPQVRLSDQPDEVWQIGNLFAKPRDIDDYTRSSHFKGRPRYPDGLVVCRTSEANDDPNGDIDSTQVFDAQRPGALWGILKARQQALRHGYLQVRARPSSAFADSQIISPDVFEIPPCEIESESRMLIGEEQLFSVEIRANPKYMPEELRAQLSEGQLEKIFGVEEPVNVPGPLWSDGLDKNRAPGVDSTPLTPSKADETTNLIVRAAREVGITPDLRQDIRCEKIQHWLRERGRQTFSESRIREALSGTGLIASRSKSVK